MTLRRATKENGIFEKLEIQWQGQYAEYDENFDEYLVSYREHSQRVIQDALSQYFIYVLDNEGVYDAFIHVNHAAIKGLPGHTIRALEIGLAPKYDYEDISADKMSHLCSKIFTGLIELSEKELEAQNVKLHMKPLDRRTMSAFAAFFGDSNNLSVKTQGAWLVAKKTGDIVTNS